MSGLLFGVDVDVKDVETENIVEDISRSSLVNKSEDYLNQQTKEQMIKDYVTNLVNKNVSEQEVKQNLQNNLKAAQATVQTNKMVFADLTFDEAEDINFTQTNLTANEIAQEYNQFRQDCIDAVNQAIDETNIVREVEDAMDAGNFDSYLNNMIAEAEKNTKQTSEQTIDAQSYQAPSFRFITLKRKEHGGGLIGADVSKQKIKDKARTSNISDDFVENVCVASVISTQDLYSRISQAYNKTVETVTKLKQEVSEINEQTIDNAIAQSNELELKGAYFGKTKGIKFTQANEAKASITAVSLIAAVTEMSSDNSQRAIASDMLDLTQSQKSRNESKRETKQSAESEKTNKQASSAKTKAKKSQAKQIVMTIAVIIVVAIIGLVVYNYFKKPKSASSKPKKQQAAAPQPQPKTQKAAVPTPTPQSIAQTEEEPKTQKAEEEPTPVQQGGADELLI